MIRSGEGRGGRRPGGGGEGSGGERKGGRGGGPACTPEPAASPAAWPRPAPAPTAARGARAASAPPPPEPRASAPCARSPARAGGGEGGGGRRRHRHRHRSGPREAHPRAPGPGSHLHPRGARRPPSRGRVRTPARLHGSWKGPRAPVAGKCPRRPRRGVGERPPPRSRHLRNAGRLPGIRDAPAADTLIKSRRSACAAANAGVREPRAQPSRKLCGGRARAPRLPGDCRARPPARRSPPGPKPLRPPRSRSRTCVARRPVFPFMHRLLPDPEFSHHAFLYLCDVGPSSYMNVARCAAQVARPG